MNISQGSDEESIIQNSLQVAKEENPSVFKKWKSDLQGKDNSNALGSWFEIFLFDRLKNYGKVKIGPKDFDSTADFLLVNSRQKIYFEAMVFRLSQDDQNLKEFITYLVNLIENLNLAVGVKIIRAEQYRNFFETDFCEEIIFWSRNENHEIFNYPKNSIPKIVLKKKQGYGVSPLLFSPKNGIEKLVSAIQMKALQHKRIIAAKQPLIISILFESFSMGEMHLKKAWIGDFKLNYDLETGEYICPKFRENGLVFKDQEIAYNGVSGFTVSHINQSDEFSGNYIDLGFLENPYCDKTVRINNGILPKFAEIY